MCFFLVTAGHSLAFFKIIISMKTHAKIGKKTNHFVSSIRSKNKELNEQYTFPHDSEISVLKIGTCIVCFIL